MSPYFIITEGLNTIDDKYYPGRQFLSEPIKYYLNEESLDSEGIQIDPQMKGKPLSNIQIAGYGIGSTEQEAKQNALQNANGVRKVLLDVK
ncbi:MAG: hypothetical protein AABX33_02290 [Nanoarchaeota archaeon]